MTDYIRDTSKLLKYIIEKMDPEQQQFVNEFYRYVQIEDNEKHVIDLEHVWKWLGFTRKDHAKAFLKSHFKVGTDYILLPKNREQDTPQCDTKKHGGHNKEVTLMKVDTFKKFCMQANTLQGGNARMYYVEMEDIAKEYHVAELKTRLLDLEKIISEQTQRENKQVEQARHISLIEAFDKQSVVYFAKVREDGDRWILKIGATDDVRKRGNALASHFGMAVFIDVIACNQNFKFETFLHNHPDHLQIQYFEDIQEGVRSSETFYVDDETYTKVIKLAKKHVGDYIGLNVDQYVEMSNIQFKRQQLELEMKKLELQQQQIDLEMKKCIMIENGIVLPRSYENETKQDAVTGKENADLPEDNDENIDDMDARLMMMMGSRRLAKGFKIQRYKEDGTLVETYQGETDALRRFPDTTSTLLQRAISTKTLYQGFRWAHLSKDKPDDEIQEIGETQGKVSGKRTGPVALFNLDKSEIVKVFPGQKAVVAYFKFKVKSSAISQALSRGNPSCGHYLQMWSECEEDVQQAYLERNSLPEPIQYSGGKAIVKIHPVTLKPIKIYTSYNHVTKIHHFSRKTLRRAIEGEEVLQGFKWKLYEPEI